MTLESREKHKSKTPKKIVLLSSLQLKNQPFAKIGEGAKKKAPLHLF